jgi:hypothetical protein
MVLLYLVVLLCEVVKYMQKQINEIAIIEQQMQREYELPVNFMTG